MEGSQAGSERVLIARAAEGESPAFDALIQPRLDRLYVTAQRILRDGAAAEDAVQQALVLAWRDLATLRDRDRFDAWLYRLLIRACYRDLRSRRRWAVRFVQLDEQDSQPAELTIHVRDELERAFRQLSPEKRAVVVLHHVTGLPLTEISEILDVPEGTVRSRLHYGLAELRKALRPVEALEPVEGTA